MPLTATSQLRTTILGVDYTIDGTLTLPDLPASPYVDFTRCLKAISLQTNIDTDVPDGVRPPSGLDYTGGTITLSGFVDPTDETKTVVWLFDPDNTASPLYHLDINDCRVLFTLGAFVGGSATAEMPTRFDGYVNGYTSSPLDGTVTLTVTDVPPSWRSTPSIPGVITVAPYNAGLTGEFAMDSLIRAMDGDSSWPKTRPQCVLSVGMRTSVTPEVGTLVPNSTDSLLYGGDPNLSFGPGKFGTALAPLNPSADNAINYDLASSLTGSMFMECWLTPTTGALGSTLVPRFDLSDQSNRPLLTVYVSTTGVRVVGDTDWTTTITQVPHYFAIEATWGAVSGGSTTVTGTVYLDSATHAFTATATLQTTNVMTQIDVGMMAGATLEAWQVTSETSPALNTGFVPHFVCNPSLNPLDAIPPVTADPNNSPYGVLQSIVGAENGFIRRRHSDQRTDGVWTFTNRQGLLNQAVADPITSNESIKTLSSTVPPSSYFRTVRVPYTGWSFDDPTTVWAIPGRKKIPAGQTVVWQQAIGQLAAAIDGTVTQLPTGASAPTDGNSYYAASRDRAGLTSHGAMTVTARLLEPGLVEITAVNAGGFDAWFVVPGDAYTVLNAGTPSLWIGGTPATAMGEAVVERVYGDGKGVLTLSSNAYIQDHDTAAALGDFWLNQLYVSYRDLDNVAIVPRADLDVGDLRRLTETNGGYFDDYVLIWGWTLDITFPTVGDDSGGTFDMGVSAKALGPPGAPLGGQIPDRFEVGTFYAYN